MLCIKYILLYDISEAQLKNEIFAQWIYFSCQNRNIDNLLNVQVQTK